MDHLEGYLHQVGFYGSDDAFADLICPFALGGIEAGEPVVFAYDPQKVELLRRWLPATGDVTYIVDTGCYATPARALVAWRKVVEQRLSEGATRVRIAGNVPHPGYGHPYAGWDRYEAAFDAAMGQFPVWAPCLYDTRIAPAEVIDAATRLHRELIERDGARRPNGCFDEVRSLSEFFPPPPEPLEATAPAKELLDPTPAVARRAIRQVIEGVVAQDHADQLVLAASEAVTNAMLHGARPVLVRIWRGDDRVVVHVHDEGGGPSDPLVGLLPGPDELGTGGRGMWIAHQLDIEVALMVGMPGFTVRLRAQRVA
ncbi:MAG TPA: sensor histidine kinase [Acidimicrobiales bacterium]|nr:sensor histidine kinase [Acidimicrobiales bacterium]